MKTGSKIIAIAAITIDGKIGRSDNHFTDWTSPEDKAFLRKLLDESDVVVVGNNTYKTALKPLSKRNCIVLTRAVPGIEKRSESLSFLNPEGASIEYVLKSYRTVALLGGMQTYTHFLDNDLIDEFYLTIEPVIFGNGVGLFKSENDIDRKFTLISSEKLNEKGSILLHYKRPLQM